VVVLPVSVSEGELIVILGEQLVIKKMPENKITPMIKNFLFMDFSSNL
jgi:hypothetical protein